MGMLERGGKVKAQVIPDRKKPAVHQVIAESIDKGAHIMTDEHVAYLGLSDDYVHVYRQPCRMLRPRSRFDQRNRELLVTAQARTQRNYVSVEPFHLFRYLDEQMFRYNNRGTRKHKITDADRFNIVLSQVAGRRLTYKEVTGKVGETSF